MARAQRRRNRSPPPTPSPPSPSPLPRLPIQDMGRRVDPYGSLGEYYPYDPADEYILWNERMARRPIDDDWVESKIINSYAVFIGYLSMAGRGLAFLVVTWTTVVLLGGFVSMLQKKDFWCLTVITLVQTAGVFDVSLKGKLRTIRNSLDGIFAIVFMVAKPPNRLLAPAYIVVCFVVVILQVLVFCIVLFPLGVLYMFGLPLSAGISLCRLIQHDYGSNKDGEANLKPALDVLYCLALVQGLLFCYKFLISLLPEKKMAMGLSKIYRFDYHAYTSVLEYLRETRRGCEKDPTFADGRNIITYAVDLLESKSIVSNLSGIRILGSLLLRLIEGRPNSYIDWKIRRTFLGQRVLLRQLLVGSASFGLIIQKLLRTLGPRSPHSMQIRQHAVRIVEHVADEIHLEQFPGGIECISSLLFEEYCLVEMRRQDEQQLPEIYERHWLLEGYERDWLLERYELSWLEETYIGYFKKVIRPPTLPPRSGERDHGGKDQIDGYNELLLRGFSILKKLAADESNCRIMIKTEGLVSKIMMPLRLDPLHHTDHWSCFSHQDVVKGSLGVMCRLGSATGEAGRNLRREISCNKKVISSILGLLKCDRCTYNLDSLAECSFRILTKLSMDDVSSGMASESREEYIETLLDTFFDDHSHRASFRKLAGENLAVLSSKSKSNAMIIINANDSVVPNLIKVLLAGNLDKAYRITAAQILESLCSHCPEDVERLKDLKIIMADVLPQLLMEIFSYDLRIKENGAETGAKEPNSPIQRLSKAILSSRSIKREETQTATEEVVDIESQKSSPQDDDLYHDDPSSHQQNCKQHHQEATKLQATLLSLSATVFQKLNMEGQDLATQLGPIACGDYSLSIARNLKKMVESYSKCTADNLRILKSTIKIAISLMKHKSCYVHEDNLLHNDGHKDMESLIDSLSDASKSMEYLDAVMMLSSGDDGSGYLKTPGYMVREAKEALEKNMAENQL